MAKHKTFRDRLKGFSIEDFQTLLFVSDDWPTAIMVGQFMDTFLEAAITFSFENVLEDKEEAEMFSGYGPLASFSSKLTVAYALGLVTKQMRDDLRVIKNIRNEAAHRMSTFSFTDKDISDLCAKLTMIDPIPQDFLDAQPLAKEAWERIGFTSARAQFSLAAGRMVMHLGVQPKSQLAKRYLLKLLTSIGSALDKPENMEKIAEFYDKLGIPHDLRKAAAAKHSPAHDRERDNPVN